MPISVYHRLDAQDLYNELRYEPEDVMELLSCFANEAKRDKVISDLVDGFVDSRYQQMIPDFLRELATAIDKSMLE